jgi:hypothetical protein
MEEKEPQRLSTTAPSAAAAVNNSVSPLCDISVQHVAPPFPAESSTTTTTNCTNSLDVLVQAAAQVTVDQKADQQKADQQAATSDMVKLIVCMCKKITASAVHKQNKNTFMASDTLIKVFTQLATKMQKTIMVLDKGHRSIAVVRLFFLAHTTLQLSTTVGLVLTDAEETEAAKELINTVDIKRILAFHQPDSTTAFANGDAAFSAAYWFLLLHFLSGGPASGNSSSSSSSSSSDVFKSPHTISFLLGQHMPKVLQAKVSALDNETRDKLAAAGLDISISSLSSQAVFSNGASLKLGIASAFFTLKSICDTTQAAFRIIAKNLFLPLFDYLKLRMSGECSAMPMTVWTTCNFALHSVVCALQNHNKSIAAQISYPSASLSSKCSRDDGPHQQQLFGNRLFEEQQKVALLQQKLNELEHRRQSMQVELLKRTQENDAMSLRMAHLDADNHMLRQQQQQYEQQQQQQYEQHQQQGYQDPVASQLVLEYPAPIYFNVQDLLDNSNSAQLPFLDLTSASDFFDNMPSFSPIKSQQQQQQQAQPLPPYTMLTVTKMGQDLQIFHGLEEILRSVRGSAAFKEALKIFLDCGTIPLCPVHPDQFLQAKGIIACECCFPEFQQEGVADMYYLGRRPSGRTAGKNTEIAVAILHRLKLLPFALNMDDFDNDFVFFSGSRDTPKPKAQKLPTNAFASVVRFAHLAWEVARHIALADDIRNQVDISEIPTSKRSETKKKNLSKGTSVIFERFCMWLAGQEEGSIVARIVPDSVPTEFRFLWLAAAIELSTEPKNKPNARSQR